MTKLPAVVLEDEQRMIGLMGLKVAIVMGMMNSKESSREWLATQLRERLRRGEFLITVKAIKAAEHQGDDLADSVCRLTYAEMANAHELMSDQLRAFGERAVLRPSVERGRGRHQWYDNWRRDSGICTLIKVACAEFGLDATRNRAARRAGHPCGTSVVTAALARNGMHLSEQTVHNIWTGYMGELVRAAAAVYPTIPD
jgi:hypothetical protein